MSKIKQSLSQVHTARAIIEETKNALDKYKKQVEQKSTCWDEIEITMWLESKREFKNISVSIVRSYLQREKSK